MHGAADAPGRPAGEPAAIDGQGAVEGPGDGNGQGEPTVPAVHASPRELERTWRAAMVRVPDGVGGVIETDVDALESGAVVPDRTYPVVIWMHGCLGFWGGTAFRLDWLARNGFVAIAPNSFARAFYPRSCDPETHTAGLYRPTLGMRQHDAGHAIGRVARFPWADRDNLFLAGLSEGAAVATTYVDREVPAGRLKARVAEAWGCHAGWEEFAGINAPATEPVLALVADRDPWYAADHHRGHCGAFMDGDNGSLSFVVDYEPTRHGHELLERPEIREIVLSFLLERVGRD